MQTILLFIILAAGFLIKLPALPLPLSGYFGSYQAINAMMAEMMGRDLPVSLFTPRSFILIDGAPSLHLLYYPFGSCTAFILKGLFKGSLDFWGHFQAALSIFFAGLLLYFIVKRLFDSTAALFACFVFSFSPMILKMGVSFQNEAVAVLFLLGSFLLLTKEGLWFDFLAGIIFSCALTARIHFLSCFPAYGFYLLCNKNAVKSLFMFLLGSAVPVCAWYAFTFYLTQTQAGIMTSFFDQAEEGRLLALSLWKTKEFYERMFEILLGEWVTPLMIPFCILGLFAWDLRRLPFVVWTLGALATIWILPQKVYDHPFYLIHGVPAASVLIGLSLSRLWPYVGRVAKWALLTVFIVVALRYYYPAAILSRSDGKRIIKIADEIQHLTSKDDRIIASDGSSSELLYYTQRFGWPFNIKMAEELKVDRQKRFLKQVAAGYGDPVKWLEYLRTQGAAYLILANPEEFQKHEVFSSYVRQNYSPVSTMRDSFLMFDLKKVKS
jgi:hypothetical protein